MPQDPLDFGLELLAVLPADFVGSSGQLDRRADANSVASRAARRTVIWPPDRRDRRVGSIAVAWPVSGEAGVALDQEIEHVP